MSNAKTIPTIKLITHCNEFSQHFQKIYYKFTDNLEARGGAVG